MQAKYAKMLKKLREYKTKCDDLEHSKRASSIETSDLDLAIQEELRSQISHLELYTKNLKQDQEKDAAERKRLQSRLDVLTAANDRMTEMKEKQDIEVEVYKTKVRELNNKLEQLNAWGDEDAPAGDCASVAASDNAAARLTEALNANRVLEDRLARLQSSISDKDEFEEERLQLTEKLQSLQSDREQLNETVQQQNADIDELRKQIRTLETQNHDYSATIDVLTVESTNIKTYLDQLKDEHKQKIDENNNLSENLKSLDESNQQLSKQIEEMRVYNLNAHDVEQRIQDLTAAVQYKEAEVANLNEQLESQQKSYDEALQRSQAECEEKSSAIRELRAQVDDLVATKNALESVAATASAPQATGQPDQPSNHDGLDRIIAELRADNAQMEQELQVLNDQVLKNLEIEDRIKATVLELDMKNIEISELKSSLEQLRSQQHSDAMPSIENDEQAEQLRLLQARFDDSESNHQAAITELNEQWQQSIEQKCSELADSWRAHLAERESIYAQNESDLRRQLTEWETRMASDAPAPQPECIAETSTASQVSTAAIDTTTDSAAVEHMQKALEAQEIEIVSLKEQLAMRSAQYARIAAQVDPYGEWSTLTSNVVRKLTTDTDNGDRTRELDHALYMLHQRDMRCEELKMEVINLLEERDGLQSKLAKTLRQIEDIKPQPR